MGQQLLDEELRIKSDELALKLLHEVNQDYKKALLVACGIHTCFIHEIMGLLDEFILGGYLAQTTKRRRGRPRKITLESNYGLSPRPKTKKPIGSPKKYLPEIPNRILAIKISYIAIREGITFAQAAKNVLKGYGLQDEKKFAKTLAEMAKKIDTDRRQLSKNNLFNIHF